MCARTVLTVADVLARNRRRQGWTDQRTIADDEWCLDSGSGGGVAEFRAD